MYISLKHGSSDEVEQVNLTKNGEYFMVSFPNNAFQVIQRRDDQFGTNTNEILINFSHEKYSAEDTTLKEVSKKLNETHSKGPTPKPTPEHTGDQVSVHFYFVNIPASAKNPFKLSIDGHLKHFITESMPLNKPEHLLVKVDTPTIARALTIEVKVEIKDCGIEAVQKFNITDNGSYIQIALINDGENVKVLQRKDNNFPALPISKKLGGTVHATPNATSSHVETSSQFKTSTTSAAPETNSSQGNTTDVTFYARGVDASLLKPFEVKVNGTTIYKCAQPMNINQMAVISGKIPKLSKGNQVVKVQFCCPKQQFDCVEEEFDLTANGTHILFEITKSSDLSYEANVEQQFHAFPSLGPEPAKVVNTSEKKGLGALSSLVQKTQNLSVSNTTNASTSTSSSLADLEKLAELKAKGILTEEEFQAKKKQILGL